MLKLVIFPRLSVSGENAYREFHRTDWCSAGSLKQKCLSLTSLKREQFLTKKLLCLRHDIPRSPTIIISTTYTSNPDRSRHSPSIRHSHHGSSEKKGGGRFLRDSRRNPSMSIQNDTISITGELLPFIPFCQLWDVVYCLVYISNPPAFEAIYLTKPISHTCSMVTNLAGFLALVRYQWVISFHRCGISSWQS